MGYQVEVNRVRKDVIRQNGGSEKVQRRGNREEITR